MIFSLLLCFELSTAQENSDYVILVHLYPFLPGDTVYGDISVPKDITNYMIKIKLVDGKKENYYAENVKCFQAKQYFFASIPYLDTRVFAKRIQEGELDLYFYDSKFHYFGGGFIGGAITVISAAANTRYFIKMDKQLSYIEVPHSSKKIRKSIASIFKDNKECYDKIMSKEFKEEQLSDLIKEYNSKINEK